MEKSELNKILDRIDMERTDKRIDNIILQIPVSMLSEIALGASDMDNPVSIAFDALASEWSVILQESHSDMPDGCVVTTEGFGDKESLLDFVQEKMAEHAVVVAILNDGEPVSYRFVEDDNGDRILEIDDEE